MSRAVTKRLVIDAGTYYLQLLTTLAVLAVLTPIIISHYGEDGYGTWALLLSFVPFLLLFDMGLNTAVTQFTASKLGDLSKNDIDRMFGAMSTVIICGALIIGLLGVVLGPVVVRVLDIGEGMQTAIAVLCLAVAIQLVSAFLSGIVYGYQKIVLVSLAQIIQQCAFLGSSLLYMRTFPEAGIEMLAFGHLTGVSCALLFSLAVIVVRNYVGFSTTLRSIGRISALRPVLPYSLRVVVNGLTSRILYNTDHIVIALFVGLSDLGKYDVAWKLCFYSTYLASAISFATFPKFSELYHEAGDNGEFFDKFIGVQRLSFAVGGSICIWLFFWWETIIALWIGDFFLLPFNVFICLLLMNLVHISSGPAGNVLTAIGKNKQMTYSEICNATLNLGLSLFLAQYLGIMGVAMGTLLAATLTSFWYLPFILCRLLNQSLLSLLTRSLVHPIMFCVIMWVLSGWLVGDNAVEADFWTFAVKTGIHGAASVLLWLGFEVFASRQSSGKRQVI